MEPFNVHSGGANAKQRHAYPAKYARCLDGTGGWAPSQGGTVVAAYGGNDTTGARAVATALNAKGGASRMDFESETFVAHTLRGTGHDASEDGTGRGVPLVPVTVTSSGRGWWDESDVGGTLRAQDSVTKADTLVCPDHWRQTCECGTKFTGPMNMPCPGCGEIRGGWTHGDPIVFNNRGREGGAQVEVDPTGLVNLRAAGGGSSRSMIAYQCHGSNVGEMGTLRKGSGSVTGGVPFVAFAENSRAEIRLEDGDGGICGPLNRGGGKPGQGAKAVASPTMGVRRLTPREMERLQGFPDDYTAIPWRGKDASECPDGPRAKALGNSMAVPVMRWIGERIAIVEKS